MGHTNPYEPDEPSSTDPLNEDDKDYPDYIADEESSATIRESVFILVTILSVTVLVLLSQGVSIKGVIFLVGLFAILFLFVLFNRWIS